MSQATIRHKSARSRSEVTAHSELPRSGYIQKPGVAAQRRTPGQQGWNANAEGVPQSVRCRPGFIPRHIARQTRRRTFEVSVAAHPEMSQLYGAPAGSGCNPSSRPHEKGLPKRHRNLAAIGTLRLSASTTSTIRVSVLAPAQRSRLSLRAGKEREHDPRYHRFEAMGCQGYGTHLRDRHGVRPVSHDSADTACEVLSRKQRADISARETDPCEAPVACGLNRVGYRTPSAYELFGNNNLGCAAARRPQANGCNRFAVFMLTLASGQMLTCSRRAVSTRTANAGMTHAMHSVQEIPRSGCTQQPGVAAQRRTPGQQGWNANAEGVPHRTPGPVIGGRSFCA